MKPLFSFFLFLPLITLAAPNGPANAKGSLSPKEYNVICTEGWDFILPTKRKLLEKAYGKPMQEKVDKDGYGNTVYDLTFKDLRVRLVDVRNGILDQIDFFSPKLKVKHGLNVGSKKSKVLELMGRPTEEVGDTAVYQTVNDGEMDVDNFVYFDFEKGVVKKIRWRPYAG